MSRSASIKVSLHQSNALDLHKVICLLEISLYFSAIIKPLSIGMYRFDVIYDVIASMETLKYGSLEAPYPDVLHWFLHFPPDYCVKWYGWMCITFQMPLVLMFITIDQLLSLAISAIRGGSALPLMPFEVQLQRLKHLLIGCRNVS